MIKFTWNYKQYNYNKNIFLEYRKMLNFIKCEIKTIDYHKFLITYPICLMFTLNGVVKKI
jgi:hypothetical protein